MRKTFVFAGFLLFATGGTISTSQRTDDWWLDPHVEVSVDYRSYFTPAGNVPVSECAPRRLFIAPWVREGTASVSAYNPEEGQTDSTPEITANGERVCEGCLATNVFPFGTVIEIEFDGETREFWTNDRMNKRYHPCRQNGAIHMDLFMWDKEQALAFGRQELRFRVKKRPDTAAPT